MDDDSKEKLKDILSTLDPVEFKWEDNNMSTHTGILVQDIATVSGMDTITLSGSNGFSIGGPIDISTITLGPINGGSGATIAAGSNGPYWTTNTGINAGSGLTINNDTGKNYIKTPKSEIDIDELADMMQTLKKRLLILTPNFEMHEKYPMLKELYDEYKAMEKLLSGPDNPSEEM
jgi:hypothetical protein